MDARNHQLEAELEALTTSLTTIGQQRKAALTAQADAQRTSSSSADADATLRAQRLTVGLDVAWLRAALRALRAV